MEIAAPRRPRKHWAWRLVAAGTAALTCACGHGASSHGTGEPMLGKDDPSTVVTASQARSALPQLSDLPADWKVARAASSQDLRHAAHLSGSPACHNEPKPCGYEARAEIRFQHATDDELIKCDITTFTSKAEAVAGFKLENNDPLAPDPLAISHVGNQSQGHSGSWGQDGRILMSVARVGTAVVVVTASGPKPIKASSLEALAKIAGQRALHVELGTR
ncbi:hypothetical protein ACWC0C_23760 [Streptomyces sp. NPDC001709]